MNKFNPYLSEYEKQTTPIQGEVALKDAVQQAQRLAMQERLRLNTIKPRKLVLKPNSQT